MASRSSDGHRRSRRPEFLKPTEDGEDGGGGGRVRARCMEDRVDVGVAEEVGVSRIVYNNPYASLSVQQQRTRLPIFKNRNHILFLLEKYRTVIIVGETGCGKSTQVPQYLMEAGWSGDGRLVCVTQPRRVAAVTLATRVAEETLSPLGNQVGYVVRFDDCSSPTTRIKYMTDGILIREILADPLLTKYSVVMVDEAHERSINSDIILGLLRKILQKRTDLRVVVSSATLDAELFRDFFNLNESEDKSKDTAGILSVEGRQYPVQIVYSKSSLPDYLKATASTALRIHKTEPTGDILAFVPGQDEVETICQWLRDEARKLRKMDRLWVVPMYGALPFREQLKVFDSTPDGTRKVVVATTIAEASVTIPGIVYVVDCGFVRLRCINAKSGIESLMTVPISRASAEQRAGRAGRIRPGKTYRLYPEAEFLKLRSATLPEVQRCELAPMILQLKALGINNVLRFHYLAPPPSAAMIRGLELLFALGALDQSGNLTSPLGLRMSEFPLPPMHAKALLSSGEFECSEEMLSVVAMLQIQDVFLSPHGHKHKAEVMKRRFSVEEGDHLTYLNVLSAFERFGCKQQWCSQHYVNYRGLCRATEVKKQLRRLLERYKVPLVSCGGEIDKIRRCVVSGFFSNAAKFHHTGFYRTLRGDYPLRIYKGSAIMYRAEFPQWVVFNEVLQNSVRDLTVIDPEWLYELAPHYYEFGTESELAEKRLKIARTS